VTPALMLCCNPVECWAGGFTKLLPNMSQDAQQGLLMMWEEMKWFYCSYMTDCDSGQRKRAPWGQVSSPFGYGAARAHGLASLVSACLHV
jgi:hypothetical protein